jgi:hypothetical protein
MSLNPLFISAQAGIESGRDGYRLPWIPAFAGMTENWS